MKVTIVIIGVLLVLMLLSMYHDKERRKEILKKLVTKWGNEPYEEYSEEKFKALDVYYRLKKCDSDIDDITWNDLDMNRVFMQINNTTSGVGEEYLYNLLRKPLLNDKELKERDRLMNIFTSQEKERLNLQMILSNMGKLTHISIYEYISSLDMVDKKNNVIHYFQTILLIASFGLCFIEFKIGIMAMATMVAWNMISYFKEKARIGSYFTVCSYIARMISCAEDTSKLDIKGIEDYQNKLKDISEKLGKLKKRGFLLAGGNSMSGSLADMILDYARMLFHIDIIQFNNIISTVIENREKLNELYEIFGLLDSMIAVASYRIMKKEYCIPNLSNIKNSKKVYLNVEDVYHPLVKNPVKASIKEDKSVLLTGSNASGKSTFLKTIAVNAILAQTINTSLSKKYEANYFRIYSSMALRDDMLNGESYYIVEIKALKRIIDNINNDTPVLCFVDEVLRGTNTLERIAASSRILYYLAQNKLMCFAATHDIELTRILENHYRNYHFEEKVNTNEVIFDYILHEGKATSRNAIKLLNMMGYPKTTINDAENAVIEFMNENKWRKI